MKPTWTGQQPLAATARRDGAPRRATVESAVAYRTPAARAEHEDLVLGSTFIAVVTPVESVEEAGALVAEQRALHPDATHHCWAYKVDSEMRSSDDGEPGGSAGRPMLEVILKRDLDRCAAVVVRYYGGRKLGVGGLARAYGGAVARALDAAGVRDVVDTVAITVKAPFASVDTVLRELQDAEAAFDADGLVATLTIEAATLPALELRLAAITRGEAVVEVRAAGRS